MIYPHLGKPPVLATAQLVWWCELAAMEAVPGVSLGTRVIVDHVAPCEVKVHMTAKDDFLFIEAYLRLRYASGTLGLGLLPTLVVSDGMATFNKRGHPDHYSIFKAAGGRIKDYSNIWEFPGQDPEWIREVVSRYWSFRYWPMTLTAAMSAVADDQRKTYPAMTDSEALFATISRRAAFCSSVIGPVILPVVAVAGEIGAHPHRGDPLRPGEPDQPRRCAVGCAEPGQAPRPARSPFPECAARRRPATRAV